MQGQMAPVNTGAAQTAAPSAWGVYFPSDAYSPQDRRVQLIQELLTSISTDAGWQLLSSGLRAVQHLTACVVALDYEQLLQHCDSANLSAALEMQPTEGLLCLQAAVHEVGKSHTCMQAAWDYIITGGLCEACEEGHCVRLSMLQQPAATASKCACCGPQLSVSCVVRHCAQSITTVVDAA